MTSVPVPELAGWTFDLREISAGAYRVTARDLRGHLVEASGENPDALLAEARRAAERIDAELAASGNDRAHRR